MPSSVVRWSNLDVKNVVQEGGWRQRWALHCDRRLRERERICLVTIRVGRNLIKEGWLRRKSPSYFPCSAFNEWMTEWMLGHFCEGWECIQTVLKCSRVESPDSEPSSVGLIVQVLGLMMWYCSIQACCCSLLLTPLHTVQSSMNTGDSSSALSSYRASSPDIWASNSILSCCVRNTNEHKEDRRKYSVAKESDFGDTGFSTCWINHFWMKLSLCLEKIVINVQNL